MSRRTRTEPEPDWSQPGGAARPAAGKPDLLETEVEALVEEWSPADRTLLGELLEDAGTELQRELLLRAVAARHTPAELHAFADLARGMDDEELFDACTVPARADVPVTHRLRAEADPLFALELNGKALSPRLEDDPGPAYPVAGGKRPRPRFVPPPALFAQPPPPAWGPRALAFDQESSSVSPRPMQPERELGRSGAEVVPRPAEAPGAEGVCALLNEAVKGLGVAYRDVRVDVGGETLERALEAAAEALARGIPVPVTLGRKAGERGRSVLLLQVQPSGKTRAFQLHDPFAQQTVWANERDLLARTELPFDAKVWRRITALALPAAPSKARARTGAWR